MNNEILEISKEVKKHWAEKGITQPCVWTVWRKKEIAGTVDSHIKQKLLWNRDGTGYIGDGEEYDSLAEVFEHFKEACYEYKEELEKFSDTTLKDVIYDLENETIKIIALEEENDAWELEISEFEELEDLLKDIGVVKDEEICIVYIDETDVPIETAIFLTETEAKEYIEHIKATYQADGSKNFITRTNVYSGENFKKIWYALQNAETEDI